MAAGRHDDSDGSDIFWPGYVDATTNLILNLLFLLTILIVAVFMFALELGKSTKKTSEIVAESAAAQAALSGGLQDRDAENQALRQEIERLKKVIAIDQSGTIHLGGAEKSIEGTEMVPEPLRGLDETIAGGFELIVRFKNNAVAFTPEEHDQLLEALAPVLKSEKAHIGVEVPTGFSEAKRMGFYRVLAVRNLLIEMNVPADQVKVAVVEGPSDADAAQVTVRAH